MMMWCVREKSSGGSSLTLSHLLALTDSFSLLKKERLIWASRLNIFHMMFLEKSSSYQEDGRLSASVFCLPLPFFLTTQHITNIHNTHKHIYPVIHHISSSGNVLCSEKKKKKCLGWKICEQSSVDINAKHQT